LNLNRLIYLYRNHCEFPAEIEQLSVYARYHFLYHESQLYRYRYDYQLFYKSSLLLLMKQNFLVV